MEGRVSAVSQRRHRRWRAVGAFLKTLPGALTAIATLVAAVAGLLTALAQIGVITIRSPIVASTPTEQEQHAAAPGSGAAPGGESGEGAAPPGGQGPGIVYLDELTPLQQPGSWFQVGAKAVNGRDFARSVAMRQPSKCQVFADQELIYDSGTMTRGRSTEVVRDMSDSFDLTFSCTPTQSVGADGEVVFGDAHLVAKPGQAPTTTTG